VSYLLDTHAFLWLVGDPEQIAEETKGQLALRDNRLLVSAISALEVAAKTRTGKLADLGLVESWSRRVADIGAEELAVTSAHALLAGSMNWEHRDPFDRVLVAQGIVESAVLVTRDRAMAGLPAPRILQI
jgi:PIN domain nuclease of toxin-antitoxin system